MSRPSSDEYFLTLAANAATRGTCSRRQVGCVLVDKRGHTMATGYNGVHRGAPHCIDAPCPGAGQPSGQGLQLCEAIHAEVNALMQCRNVNKIRTLYCTASPCVQCMRLLCNTGVKRIVFLQEYPHAESASIAGRAGIEWSHYRPDLSTVAQIPDPLHGRPVGGAPNPQHEASVLSSVMGYVRHGDGESDTSSSWHDEYIGRLGPK